jgi:hypothetical protein
MKLARERRDEARRQLATGIDPSVKRRTETIAESDSFEAVAGEWFTKFSAGLRAGAEVVPFKRRA